jgi:hypothetical protein
VTSASTARASRASDTRVDDHAEGVQEGSVDGWSGEAAAAAEEEEAEEAGLRGETGTEGGGWGGRAAAFGPAPGCTAGAASLGGAEPLGTEGDDDVEGRARLRGGSVVDLGAVPRAGTAGAGAGARTTGAANVLAGADAADAAGAPRGRRSADAWMTRPLILFGCFCPPEEENGSGLE